MNFRQGQLQCLHGELRVLFYILMALERGLQAMTKSDSAAQRALRVVEVHTSFQLVETLGMTPLPHTGNYSLLLASRSSS